MSIFIAMLAIWINRFGDASGFFIKESPIPTPKEGEVRIRIKAAGFNPVDWKVREGWYGGDPNLILGFDCSGIVDAIGPGVTRFDLGDEVYAMAFHSSNGTYAQYTCVPSQLVAQKPAPLSFEKAAAIPLAAMTAYRAVIATGAFKKGDRVFACGLSGGVGSFATQFLKQLGVSEIVTIPSDQKGDQLFDATLDLIGGEWKKLCLELTGYSGHFVTILPEKDFQMPFWEENAIPRARNLSVHQINIGAEMADPTQEKWKIYTDHLEIITQMFEEGTLEPPLVQVVGPLSVETVQEAHRLLETRKVKGKLVMVIP